MTPSLRPSGWHELAVNRSGQPTHLGFTARMRVGLHRLADLPATAIRLGRTAPARFAGRLLAAGFIAFLAVRLWQLWRDNPVDLSRLDAGVATLAVTVSVLAVASYGVVWLFV